MIEGRMHRLGTLLAGILLCALAATEARVADAATPGALTAAQILTGMAETYQRCKTYRDSGVVKTVFIMPDQRTRTVEKPFTTAFVRPDRFRFEYQDNSLNRTTRYIVWREGTKVQIWWDIKPGVTEQPSLRSALSAAAGVSGGSSLLLPALLLPSEIPPYRLAQITEVARIEDAKLGEVECFRVQGKFANDLMTLWIDSTTFLLRRIDTGHSFDAFRTETTTTYEAPAKDNPVSEEKLAFNPPLQK